MAETTSYTKETFNALLQAVSDNGWVCIKNEENLTVQYGVTGEAVQMNFYIMLDDQKQLAILVCKLPLTFGVGNRVDGAVATSAINYELIDGNFAYDFPNGLCHFKQTLCYRDSAISPKAFEFMLNYSVRVIEKYYKRLYRISLGLENA